MKNNFIIISLATVLAIQVPGMCAPGSGETVKPAAVEVSSRPAVGLDWREDIRIFAAGHFKHPAWGYSHAVRTYELARKLAAADKAVVDDDVLYAAAYLHDMAAFPPWAKEKADHADEAANVVDTVLKAANFPAGKLEAVRGAVRTHMFDRTPSGAEALYLHDADALDWLGVIGAARLIALVDPSGGAPDAPAIVRSLDDTLAKVPARVLSPAGRALLPARKAELAEFLKDLRAETDDLKTL